MSASIRVLVFAGSARQASFNQTLGRLAVQRLHAAGAETTYIDLGSLDIPLYHGDLEATVGLPPGVRTLRAALLQHDALFIASPEYNGFFSPLLKNALDWASRKQPDEVPRAAFIGKIALLASATRGESLGLRGLHSLRTLLGSLKVESLPEVFSLPRAGEAFSGDGTLLDAVKEAEFDKLLGQLQAAVIAARHATVAA